MNKANPNDRLLFPATERNREAILEALTPKLKQAQQVLEVGSGSGQHIAYLAPRFPNVIWQPSDIDPVHRRSILAWTAGIENVLTPLDLDAMANSWNNLGNMDLVFSANMIHIAPWEACLGLLAHSSKVLKPNGSLALYGPFMEKGCHNAASNFEFDKSLKARDPNWGIRDLSLIKKTALNLDLKFEYKITMPANNFTVFFQRQDPMS